MKRQLPDAGAYLVYNDTRYCSWSFRNKTIVPCKSVERANHLKELLQKTIYCFNEHVVTRKPRIRAKYMITKNPQIVITESLEQMSVEEMQKIRRRTSSVLDSEIEVEMVKRGVEKGISIEEFWKRLDAPRVKKVYPKQPVEASPVCSRIARNRGSWCDEEPSIDFLDKSGETILVMRLNEILIEKGFLAGLTTTEWDKLQVEYVCDKYKLIIYYRTHAYSLCILRKKHIQKVNSILTSMKERKSHGNV